MGMPMLIGAGIGALGSAAMGKSPFTGALLGGVSGGAFGGGAGFGSGFTEGGLAPSLGLGSAAPAASTAGGWVAPSFANAAGIQGVNGQIGSSLLASGVSSNAIPLATQQALQSAVAAQNPASSLLGGATQDGLLSQWGNTAFNAMKGNPLGTLSGANSLYSAMTQHPQQQPVQGGGVRAGNPNMVANIPEMLQVSDVAPSILPSKESKAGQIGNLNAQDILKRIPLSQLFNQESI